MASLTIGTTCSSSPIVASLSFRAGSAKPSLSFKAAAAAAKTPGLLHCSFLPSSSLSFSSNSSFSGGSFGLKSLDLCSNFGDKSGRRQGLVVRAKKFSLCQTKRNRSRKSLARTHGFRKRMSTTSGRAIIQRRRAKGRWNLCTKTNPINGKGA